MPACCSIQRAAVCSLSQKVSALIWVEELQPVWCSTWSWWWWVFPRAQAMRGVFETPGMKLKGIPSLSVLGWEKSVAVHSTAEIPDNFAGHRPCWCEVCIANYSILSPPSCAVLCWFIPPKDGGGKRMCCIFDSADLRSCMHHSGHPWGISACKSLLKHEHFPIHI